MCVVTQTVVGDMVFKKQKQTANGKISTGDLHTEKSLPDQLGNACLFNNSGKKTTILLTKVPQIIHFVMCKFSKSTVTSSYFLYYMD